MKNLFFVIVLLLMLVPTSVKAKPLSQQLVAVKYALYIDTNNNMQMDMFGSDVCVKGGANSPLTWAINAVGGLQVATSTVAGSDYGITSYSGWLNCHQFDTVYNPVLVEETWYTLRGCGNYLETIYVGSYEPGAWYSIAHRVGSTEPNC